MFRAVETSKYEVMCEARHDLESVYWLLLFIMPPQLCRHGGYRNKTFTSVFAAIDWFQLAMTKLGWLLDPDPPVIVPSNPALSDLLDDLREALEFNSPAYRRPVQRVTYARILAVFEKALSNEDWPQDAVPEEVPPRDYTESASDILKRQKNIEDDFAGTHFLDLRLSVETEYLDRMDGPVDGSDDVAGGAIAQGPAASTKNDGQPMDEENMMWQGSSAQVDLPAQPAQPVAAPSHTSHLPTTQFPLLGAAEVLSQPPTFDIQPLALPAEAEAPDLVAGKRPKSRTRARSTHRAELPGEPRHGTGKATRTAASRKAAATWPASKAERDREEPPRRYNLRSSAPPQCRCVRNASGRCSYTARQSAGDAVEVGGGGSDQEGGGSRE